MSVQLMIQLKKERDEASMKVYKLKKILEDIANDTNIDTMEPFQSKEEILEFINKKLQEIK